MESAEVCAALRHKIRSKKEYICIIFTFLLMETRTWGAVGRSADPGFFHIPGQIFELPACQRFLRRKQKK
jgi:hypothetical protein